MKDINSLFNLAVDKNASDLHLVAGCFPLLRVDGELKPLEDFSLLTQADIQTMIFSILTEEEKQNFLSNKDLDKSHETEAGNRFRVNLSFEKGNMKLVARAIKNKIPSFEEIALSEIVEDLIRSKQGLILVTGPTGSGKSTSLAAMVNYLNEKRELNIITLEDPIEYMFTSKKSLVTQRQLGSDMKNFSAGIKHVLRQDPDVIMIGELRDLESIAAAITLAETGHLVLATLHTNSSCETINRIIDIFPPHQQTQVRVQLAMTLKAVISQRLLPRVGGGRIAGREILINNTAVANIIRENKIPQINLIIETNMQEGMISLDKDLIRLFEEGKIDKQTALENLKQPERLEFSK